MPLQDDVVWRGAQYLEVVRICAEEEGVWIRGFAQRGAVADGDFILHRVTLGVIVERKHVAAASRRESPDQVLAAAIEHVERALDLLLFGGGVEPLEAGLRPKA